MAASQSVEYATLVQCTEKLARGISQDPLSMANKLLEAGLVPPTLVSKMLLPSGENYSKATELVLQVIKVVAGFPQKFHVFMKILKDCYWLNDLAETVCGQYEVTKKDQDEVIQVREDTEELKNLRLEKEKLERLLLLEKEEAEKLLLEKEEIERERNMLLREIDSKDENMSKLLEVLTSVQGKDRENVKMRMKTEAENRSLNRKIRIIEKEKRSLKNQLQTEKEIRSLKRGISGYLQGYGPSPNS